MCACKELQLWMHARFLGVSRHVITWLSLLCFRLPPPPLDFKVETVRGWSNGDISIPPSGTKAKVCKMQKTHGTPHSLEKLRFRWDVLGLLSNMVQNLRVVLLKHRKTSGFVYV